MSHDPPLRPIDILVNNAGIQYVNPIEAFPVDVWNRMLAINLSAPLLLMRAAIPYMRKARWGRIVNLGSAHSLVGSANKVPYAAAKHGIVGLTKGAAIELGQYDITCNAIAPGFVATPLFRSQAEGVARHAGVAVDDVMARQMGEKQAIDRLITPEEIAESVRYLCSDAARTVTGVVLPVDGGWVAQ